MTKLALKIDVDTYRGTREGVPRLIEALKRIFDAYRGDVASARRLVD